MKKRFMIYMDKPYRFKGIFEQVKNIVKIAEID